MTTWVLLRGLMRESRHWGDFPRQFQHIIGDVHLVTLDFPGNGSLHTQASMSSVAAMADYCRTQLKSLGCSPRYNVIALSLGAMVAIAWAERHPDEFERMVLINTSLAPYNPFYHRLRPANYPALIRSLFFSSIAQREGLILRITSAKEYSSEQEQAILKRWASYAEERPVTRVNFWRQLKAAALFRAAPNAPLVPVLLLAGMRDQLVNVKCSLTLAERWHCSIKLHPTAGHDLPLDDGNWVAQQVKNWNATQL